MQGIQTYQRIRPLIGDYVLSGSIAVLSVGVIVSAVRMPRAEGWGEAPGLIPLICALGLLAMAAILALATWRRSSIGEAAAAESTSSEQHEPLELGRTLLVGGSVIVYALVLIPLLGYTFATLVYLCTVIGYFWQGKILWVFVISLGATGFLSQTFKHAFSIILP